MSFLFFWQVNGSIWLCYALKSRDLLQWQHFTILPDLQRTLQQFSKIPVPPINVLFNAIVKKCPLSHPGWCSESRLKEECIAHLWQIHSSIQILKILNSFLFIIRRKIHVFIPIQGSDKPTFRQPFKKIVRIASKCAR